MSTSASRREISISAAIDRATSLLRSPPKVERVTFELGKDAAGDEAVYITVVLASDTRDEDWVSAKLDPISSGLRKAILESVQDAWPYVRFARAEDTKAA